MKNEKLDAFLYANRLKSSDLVEFWGVTKGVVSQILNGTTKLPTKRLNELLNNDKGWDTSMLIGDLNGGAITIVKRSYVSHYCWLSDDEICAHATVEPGKQSLYVFDAYTGAHRELALNYCSGELDIHSIVSPDGKYVIGDGYPEDGYRPLVAIELATKKSTTLLRAYSIAPDDWDIRCDLHARFILGGRYISYDTTENSRREIAIFPTSKIKFN